MRATVLNLPHHAVCLLAVLGGMAHAVDARGLLTSLSAATMGALFSIVGTCLMLAVWHDPATLDAWRGAADWTRRSAMFH